MVMIYVQRGEREWFFTSRYDAGVRDILKTYGGRWNGTSWLVRPESAHRTIITLKGFGHTIVYPKQQRDPLHEARTDFGATEQDDPSTWGPEEYARASRAAGDAWREANGTTRGEHRARWSEQNEHIHFGAGGDRNADGETFDEWFSRYMNEGPPRASGYRHQPPPRPPRADRGERTWADDLLAKADPALAARIFKALAAVLHPDAGGTTELMQHLNAARDRSKDR